jgi:hypothetical protein
MIVPTVLGGSAILATLFGGAKGLNAFFQNAEAKDIVKMSNDLAFIYNAKLEQARNKAENALHEYGKCKAKVIKDELMRYVGHLSMIKNVELADSIGIGEAIAIAQGEFAPEKFVVLDGVAQSLLKGVPSGMAAGAMAAFGAYGGTMMFGTASTGAAIASLNGVAAINATLAFLGGGALAAGGGGVALGVAVFGGVMLGPAIAVLGIFMDAQASAHLDRSYIDLEKVCKACEEIKSAIAVCGAIEERANMFNGILIETNEMFKRLITRLEDTIDNFGCDYSTYPEYERKVVAISVSFAQAIKSIIDMPLLLENGGINPESSETAQKIMEMIR